MLSNLLDVESGLIEVWCYDFETFETGKVDEKDTFFYTEEIHCERNGAKRLFDVDFKLIWLRRFFQVVEEITANSSNRRVVITRNSPRDVFLKWNRFADVENGSVKLTHFINENVKRLRAEKGIVLKFCT